MFANSFYDCFTKTLFSPPLLALQGSNITGTSRGGGKGCAARSGSNILIIIQNNPNGDSGQSQMFVGMIGTISWNKGPE
jgi:hypothetical protein